MKKAQLALEFILIFAFFGVLIVVGLIIIGSISDTKINQQSYYELDDLGVSLQQELILAAEMEHGYTRRINIPTTLKGKNYNITHGSASNLSHYLLLEIETAPIYYYIPQTEGNFSKGVNYIKKINNSIIIENE